MRTKSKQHYIDTWTSHARRMINLYLDADIDLEIWERDFTDMKRIIEKAAKRNEEHNVFNQEDAA